MNTEQTDLSEWARELDLSDLLRRAIDEAGLPPMPAAQGSSA